MIGKSLLRAPLKPGERLVCYCPPGVCQAPKGLSGPCNRATDVAAAAEAEYQSWIPVMLDYERCRIAIENTVADFFAERPHLARPHGVRELDGQALSGETLMDSVSRIPASSALDSSDGPMAAEATPASNEPDEKTSSGVQG